MQDYRSSRVNSRVKEFLAFFLFLNCQRPQRRARAHTHTQIHVSANRIGDKGLTLCSSLYRLMTYKFMDKLKNAEGLVVRGPKGKKPKQRYPRLGRGQIIPTAQALHRRMYTAFAEYIAPFSPSLPFLFVPLSGSSLWAEVD